jgi:hypothetical protein
MQNDENNSEKPQSPPPPQNESAEFGGPTASEQALREAERHIDEAIAGVHERISMLIGDGITKGIQAYLARPGEEREYMLMTQLEQKKGHLLDKQNQLLDVERKLDLMFRVVDRLGARLKFCANGGFNDAATEIVEVIKVATNLRRKVGGEETPENVLQGPKKPKLDLIQ